MSEATEQSVTDETVPTHLPDMAGTSGTSVADSLALPIEAYMSTSRDVRVKEAHDSLVRRCMESLGFEWEGGSRSEAFGVMSRRYSFVIDRETAAEFGYHVPHLVTDESEDGESVSDEMRFALAGEPPWIDGRGGCFGEADRHLAGDSEFSDAGGLGIPSIVSEVNFGSYARSLEDPDVQEAFAAWSSCMAERGYDRDDPTGNSLPPGIMESPSPTPAEIEMALWDVECQERTGLVETWFEVESKIQLEMIDERAEEFAQVASENDEIFRRAAAVLEADGG